MKYFFRLSLTFSLALLMTECAGSMSRQNLLQESVFYFHADIRFENYSRAGNYVIPSMLEKYLDIYKNRNEMMQVEEFEIKDIRMVGDDEAIATVIVSHHFKDSITMAKMTVIEKWKYMGKRWFVVEQKILE
jgi:hypothetical protein